MDRSVHGLIDPRAKIGIRQSKFKKQNHGRAMLRKPDVERTCRANMGWMPPNGNESRILFGRFVIFAGIWIRA